MDKDTVDLGADCYLEHSLFSKIWASDCDGCFGAEDLAYLRLQHFFYLSAWTTNKQDQVHKDVEEIGRHVVPADPETHLWVRHEVCEHHHAIGQQDDGALVEDFHIRGEMGL